MLVNDDTIVNLTVAQTWRNYIDPPADQIRYFISHRHKHVTGIHQRLVNTLPASAPSPLELRRRPMNFRRPRTILIHTTTGGEDETEAKC